MEELYEALAERAFQMRQYLTDRAMEDAEFREQLLSDPKTVIADEFGVELPEDFTIMVHQNDANTFHLALPVGPELSEEQLEMIAGGVFFCM